MSQSSSSSRPLSAWTIPCSEISHPEPLCDYDQSRDSTSSIGDYVEKRPAYSFSPVDEKKSWSTEKSQTLAELYFKFGFVFPFLWLAGVWILWSPLKEDPTLPWLVEMTPGEKQMVLARMRREELVWARRCCWASVMFCIIALAITFSLLGLHFHRAA
ncbi:hypothetical protein C8J56DRAFT_1040096 [Mycena floridula]|nr:hypothetical protein C8J56DRAFT_1040096 [Mycena floridula]